MSTQCIMHAGFVFSAHAHNNYELVKVVNSASGICFRLLAIHRLECKALPNQNVRYIYLVRSGTERVSGFIG